MKDNSIIVNDNIEIYQNKIDEYTDEYINQLDNQDDIYNTYGFKGLLKYLYVHIFKNDNIVKGNQCSILDYNNIKELDDVWYLYSSLAYKYKHGVSILDYCVLTGIEYRTIEYWTNDPREANKPRTLTIKKWKNEAESNLYRNVEEKGSIGSMFLLKCNYGYKEAANTLEIIHRSIDPAADADMIADKYGEIKGIPGDND